MSAPDWRDVFARALHDARNNPMEWDREALGGAIDGYHKLGDAILAAIAARGYRLHRDHDYQRVGLASHLKCVRCGQRNDGLIPHSSCEGGA